MVKAAPGNRRLAQDLGGGEEREEVARPNYKPE